MFENIHHVSTSENKRGTRTESYCAPLGKVIFFTHFGVESMETYLIIGDNPADDVSLFDTFKRRA